MTRTKYKQIISSLITGGLLLLGLFLWLNASPPTVHADPGDLFVTASGSGTDCSQAAPCALQTALGQAVSGDAIYLAAGTYTGSGDAVVTVTQSITIYGGWDGTTTAPPARNPSAHPTTLDGEGARHVIYSYVFGITPTLDGLRITNGSATYGGGINSIHVNLVLRDCWVFGNTATQGGGIHVTGGDSVLLTGNKVYSNTATTIGGGIRVWDSDSPTLAGNKVYSNTATTYGGGIYITDSDGAALTANQIYSNTATGQDGGGICLSSSDGATLADNHIYDNTAGYGGGMRLRNSDDVTLLNNMVVGNRVIAGHSGSGIYIDSVTAHFFHTTLARNHGGVGRGLYVYSSLSTDSAIWLTNTILAGHTTGIYATADQTVTLQNTLWGIDAWANGTDIAGAGTIVSDTNDWGDPAFIAPDSGDYHIASHSAAVGWGMTTGVSADIDGDPRPFCKLSDLGADESPCCVVLNAGTYYDVQSAVDSSSSPGDVVKVAGVCRGVQKRGVLYQAVYITKTLTIRGGYDAIFTEPPDPDTHPSTLDALGQGRVVHITNDITPTLEGLRLTNGSNSGGVYASGAHPIISNCHIFSNTSSGYGGGVELEYGTNAYLVNNEIYNNTASSWSGGGVDIFQGHNATLTNNKIYNNMAASNGGGINIEDSSDVTLINNMVVENQASGDGSGIHLTSSATARALHTTLARNSNGNGQGIYLGSETSLWLTNTILVSHTIGIDVNGALTASHTLWGAGAWANVTDTINSGTIVSSTNLYGDPVFVDATDGDYHIRFASAAVNAGTDAGVDDDIDGDTRPQRGGYDVGADEFASAGEFFVTSGGGSATCLQSDPCTMDTALGLAGGGDTVYVSGGTYTGSGEAVVSIIHSIRLYGGWDGAPSGPVVRDPDANRSILDGEHARRVIYINGAISPTVDGFTITGGNGSNASINTGRGGGIYSQGAAPIIANNVITNNVAYTSTSVNAYGGGLYVASTSGNSVITANRVLSNAASTAYRGYGGGICLFDAPSTLAANNSVLSNTASITGGQSYGGGIYFTNSDAITVTGNQIAHNSAQAGVDLGQGGGIYCYSSDDATLDDNTVQHNTAGAGAGNGGGIRIIMCHRMTIAANTIQDNVSAQTGTGSGAGLSVNHSRDLSIDANRVSGNVATSSGGGIYLYGDTTFTMTNNIVADNQASSAGGGIAISPAGTPISGTMVHNTLAANRQGSGDGRIGVYIGGNATIVLTNNLIYSHTYGVSVAAGSTTTLYNTLFYANSDADTGGAGNIANTDPITGQNPLLDADYHLLDGSAAVDAGLALPWIASDIDGDTRPRGGGYDVGADESPFTCIGLTGVGISGRTAGYTGTLYSFTAVITPSDAFACAYIWSPEPESGQGTASVQYQWPTSATHTITLTAANCGGSAIATHTVAIQPPPPGCLHPLSNVSIDGPGSGYTNTLYAFTATVLPADTTPPITYTWQATGQGDAVSTTSDISHTIFVTWTDLGVKAITVTAQNCADSDSNVVTITIEPLPDCPYPLDNVTIDGPTSGYTGTWYSFTAVTIPSNASTPITYTWVPTPDVGSGAVVSYTWDISGDKTITVTAENCDGSDTDTHTITIEGKGYNVYLPLVLRDT